MATNVLMPKWGMTMEQGLVSSWLKKEGDSVEQGEALVEVESSKATEFVEAPASGVLARILVPEGKTVPITTVIAIITAAGELIPEEGMIGGQHPASTSPMEASPPAGIYQGGAVSAPRREGHRVAASPAARRLAREHHVDLSLLQGSGPDGMIVVEDVETALKVPAPAGDVATGFQPVESDRLKIGPHMGPISRAIFYSQGHKLDGICYLPKDYQAGMRLPGVVFCLGYTYLKDLLVPEMAKRLSAQGYACLVFDYRGFGKSELGCGPPGRLLPLEQVADIQAAVTFLAARPEVDANRIGLVGISLGGSHALYAAGINERVRAVAALAPVGDGQRWLRGCRRYWEWVAFLEKIEADRTARVLGGIGERVDAWEIVIPDPASRAFLEVVWREFPALKCRLSLESAEALIDYCPETWVGRISPRPVLLLHGEADLLVPVDESRSLFAQAGEPRELVLVPGMGHFDWAMPHEERFDHVMRIVSHWLGGHLACEPGGRETPPSPTKPG
jgi:pimeloyl-ACP methyl ester carboxylesterase